MRPNEVFLEEGKNFLYSCDMVQTEKAHRWIEELCTGRYCYDFMKTKIYFEDEGDRIIYEGFSQTGDLDGD